MSHVRIGLSSIILLTGILATGCATPQSPEPLAAANNTGSWSQAFEAASVSPPAPGAAAASLQKTFSSLTDSLRITPRVVPAADPVSLASQPAHVGADLHYHAAQVYESQGNLVAATTYYQKALQVDPNDYQTLLSCGRLHDRQGEFRQAEVYYQRAIASQPRNPAAWNDLGMCYARNGDPEAALTALGNAAAAQPLDPLYRNNLAAVLVDLQRYDEALRQLIAVHAESVAHYNLGFLLAERRQTALAQQEFAAALQFDPNMIGARNMLARLDGPVANSPSASPPVTQDVRRYR